MDILNKISEVKTEYAVTQQTIKNKQDEINKLQSNLLKLEGSFNMLIELAKEANLIDEQGNPIKSEPTKLEADTKECDCNNPCEEDSCDCNKENCSCKNESTGAGQNGCMPDDIL